jgi:hypothetical protein
MGRIGQNLPDPNNPKSLVDFLGEVRRVVDGNIEFGNPQDPADDTSSTLAGSTTGAHPGTLSNIKGTWCEADVDTLDSPITFYHNLNIDVAVSGEPNVRWLFSDYVHDGTGVTDGTAVISCNFEPTTCTVTTTSIDLQFYAAGGRTVDVTHLLKVSLFFVPAVRRP